MKKLTSFFLILNMILSVGVMPVTADESITVKIDSVPVTFDVAPCIINDKTMVPMRVIFESLGATVTWEGDTKTAICVKGDTTVTISAEASTLYKNNAPIALDLPTVIIEDRMFVPIRAIAESFGCAVDWNNDTKTVIIDTTAKAVISIEHDKIIYKGKEYVPFETAGYKFEKNQLIIPSVQHEGEAADCEDVLYSVNGAKNDDFIYVESSFDDIKSAVFVSAEKAQTYQSVLKKLSNKNNFLNVIYSPTVEIDGITHYRTFFDDFNGTNLDLSKWSLAPEESRQDANGRWDNSMTSLDGEGNLVITSAIAENGQPVSGAIYTKEKFEQTTGYFEIRCRLQKAEGFWGAFWLMSETQHLVGNGATDGVEIDIFESYDVNEKMIHQTLHWDGYEKYHKVTGKSIAAPDCYDGKFHTFSLLWTDEEYVFFVDGKETYRLDETSPAFPGICTKPVYLLISSEFGTWAGSYNASSLPDNILVDYVKVYIAG